MEAQFSNQSLGTMLDPTVSFHDGTTAMQPLAVSSRIVLAVTTVLIGIVSAVLNSLMKARPIPGLKRLPRLPGVPWIGRVWDVPTSGAIIELARHFSKFDDHYGPIYEWRTFGVTRVMINSESIVHNLLVQQGKHYSDRPDVAGTLGVKTGSFLPVMGIGTYGPFVAHRMMF